MPLNLEPHAPAVPPGVVEPCTREVLSLRLGDDTYGLDIQNVQEIRAYERATRVAHAPACVKGVLNLRGAIVPVIDLRIALGLPPATALTLPVLVVLGLGRRCVGLVADAVSDTLRLQPQQVQPLPAALASEGPVQAIVEVEGRALLLLEPQRLLAAADLGLPGTLQ